MFSVSFSTGTDGGVPPTRVFRLAAGYYSLGRRQLHCVPIKKLYLSFFEHFSQKSANFFTTLVHTYGGHF